MEKIALVQEIIKLIFQLFIVAFICWRWQDIKQILCGEDGKMSSKRVISIMCASTLCRLAVYTTNEKDGIDNNVLAVFTIIILTASAIATFPQVMDLFGKIKGIGTKAETTTNTNIDAKIK